MGHTALPSAAFHSHSSFRSPSVSVSTFLSQSGKSVSESAKSAPTRGVIEVRHPRLASSLPSLTLPLFDPLGGKVPKYAQALMKRYDADMEELRKGPSGARSSQGEGGTTGMLAETMKDVKGWGTVLRELLLL